MATTSLPCYLYRARACGNIILNKLLLTPPFLETGQGYTSDSMEYVTTLETKCRLAAGLREGGRQAWVEEEVKQVTPVTCGLRGCVILRNNKMRVRESLAALVLLQWNPGWQIHPSRAGSEGDAGFAADLEGPDSFLIT